MAVCIAWIVLAMVLRGLLSEDGITVTGIMAWEPVQVMENIGNLNQYGDLFAFEFWKYGISAVVIIAITSGIGYVCFLHSDAGGTAGAEG